MHGRRLCADLMCELRVAKLHIPESPNQGSSTAPPPFNGLPVASAAIGTSAVIMENLSGHDSVESMGHHRVFYTKICICE